MGNLMIKKKEGRTWQFVDPMDIADMRLRDIMDTFMDKDVVMQFAVGDTSVLACGTDSWVDYYRDRGRTCYHFRDAISIIDAVDTTILDSVIVSRAFAEALPGSRVLSMRTGKDIGI